MLATIGQVPEPGQSVASPPPASPSLGLTMETLTPARARNLGLAETRGVLVRHVDERGPAAKAGIQAGDLIVEVDHQGLETGG
jgi:S1-C subfamily serine protease